jgi:ATP-dependent DNA helicase RecG
MRRTEEAEIRQWLEMPRETEHLEFKEAKNSFDEEKLYRYCVALANEGGGKLILGITDKPPRSVVGSVAFPNPDKIAKDIFNKLHFRVDVEELNHTDKRLVIFHIPSRPSGTAYQLEGSYLMRSTESVVAMSEDRLRQIFNEGKPNWLGEIARENCREEDIIRLLDTQSYFDLLGQPYPQSHASIVERFEREQLVMRRNEHWHISNLGAILFAKRLEDFPSVERKAARFVVYEGVSKMSVRLDITDTKGYAAGFEGLIGLINAQVPSNTVVEQALRREVRMFPPIAIRELVANALIHQDFNEIGSSVMIELYTNRLEISNPGLPFIAPERFIDGYQSRNEKLADIMRRLHICEELGSGIDKVIQAAEAYQLPAPDFFVGERRTSAILFVHKEFEEMNRTDRIRACYQHCVLRYVMKEKMTNQTLRERFNLSEKKSESISRVIRETVESNLIKLEDPTVESLRYRNYIPIWA